MIEALQLKRKVYIRRHTIMTARKSKFISHTANGTHFSPTFLTSLCKMTLFTLIYFLKNIYIQ